MYVSNGLETFNIQIVFPYTCTSKYGEEVKMKRCLLIKKRLSYFICLIKYWPKNKMSHETSLKLQEHALIYR